ncbi:CPXV217 protein [Cowpox virus]|uniref:CPXV217 protein n=1 Tax=Cowpox virus TaxID=10243 RepID=U5TH76_COWPX|nr:CPXV217 protein [Cowpox virus]
MICYNRLLIVWSIPWISLKN